MRIHVAGAVGRGPTTLSAFDSALCRSGVADRNLVRLSSVIPARAELLVHDGAIPAGLVPGEWGDRLYVVYAEMRVDAPNTEAWAGLGWVRDPVSGEGLLVEHEGESEQKVRRDIDQSLRALMGNRGVDWPEVRSAVVGATCTREPVCAFVVAAYESASWGSA